MATKHQSVQLLSTPSLHQKGLLSGFYSALNHASEALVQAPLFRFSTFSRDIVIRCVQHWYDLGRRTDLRTPSRSLSAIKRGRITLINGHDRVVHGTTDSHFQCNATIEVRRDTFWTRVVLGRDLGFAEAYIHGDCECYKHKSLPKKSEWLR